MRKQRVGRLVGVETVPDVIERRARCRARGDRTIDQAQSRLVGERSERRRRHSRARCRASTRYT